MTDQRILMSTPDVGQIEEDYVVDALRSGWIAPLGPDVDAFEQEMADRIGVQHAVALSSGTAALHLGLLGLGVQPGDVVVTATMTFAATANAVMYTGAEPYFVDCDPVTGNMDPELLREVLNELHAAGTPAKVVVPVDLLGKAVDYTAISGVCDEFGAVLFCDAAESLGAHHRGKPAGAFGEASVVSFNGNKIMTTSGGGMLLTNNKTLAEHARYLATQARQPVVHYEHVDVGYNYRLSNLLAALGRAQLSRLDEMISKRRRWRDGYREFVKSVEGIEIFGGDDSEDNFWLTSFIIDPETAPVTADQLRLAMDREGIETRPLWKPMHLQPVFRNSRSRVNGSSQMLFEQGLTLPSGSAMKQDAFDRVIDALTRAVKRS